MRRAPAGPASPNGGGNARKAHAVYTTMPLDALHTALQGQSLGLQTLAYIGREVQGVA